MSGEIKTMEIDEFEKKFGYKPTKMRTSIDKLAIYVNKDNPIECLGMEQLDGVLSKSRACGDTEDIKSWSQLGRIGDWTNRPISFYGRNSAARKYCYIKKHALSKDDCIDSVTEQPGSTSVVQGVAGARFAIGYSEINNKASGVHAVPNIRHGISISECGSAQTDGLCDSPSADHNRCRIEFSCYNDYKPTKEEILYVRGVMDLNVNESIKLNLGEKK